MNDCIILNNNILYYLLNRMNKYVCILTQIIFSCILILFDGFSISINSYILTHIFRLSLSYNTKQLHFSNTFFYRLTQTSVIINEYLYYIFTIWVNASQTFLEYLME